MKQYIYVTIIWFMLIQMLIILCFVPCLKNQSYASSHIRSYWSFVTYTVQNV